MDSGNWKESCQHRFGWTGKNGEATDREATGGDAVVHAVARNHVEDHDGAAADCKGRGSFFSSSVDDYRLTVEKQKSSVTTPHPAPPTRKQSTLEAIEETSLNL